MKKVLFLPLILSFALVPNAHARKRKTLDMCADPNFESDYSDTAGGKLEPREPQPTDIKPESKSLSMSLGKKDVTVNYEEYPAVGTAKGTVIYLCGGPGLPCLSDGRPAGVPTNMNVIMFDYAGIGQNKTLTDGEQMSIEGQAKIVEAIARDQKLTDYTLDGSSFGTAVATVAASDLSKDPTAIKPKMVVLDGVVGNLDCFYNLPDAFTRASDRAWQQLSADEKIKFVKGYDKMIKEIKPVGHHWLDERLNDAIKRGPKHTLEALRDVIADKLPPPKHEEPAEDEAGTHEWRSAGCQQTLAHQPAIHDMYFGGKVAYTDNDDPGPTECDCPLVHRPFDPKNFQISNIPVLYIDSQVDISTPIECAHYHLAAQNEKEDKFMLTPVDVSHASLDYELKDCGSLIWNAAMKGDIDTIKKNSKDIESSNCPADGVQTATKAQQGSSSR